jgi:hypothetical protein
MSTISDGDVSETDISPLALTVPATFLPTSSETRVTTLPNGSHLRRAPRRLMKPQKDEHADDETEQTDEQSDESPDADGEEGSETMKAKPKRRQRSTSRSTTTPS